MDSELKRDETIQDSAVLITKLFDAVGLSANEPGPRTADELLAGVNRDDLIERLRVKNQLPKAQAVLRDPDTGGIMKRCARCSTMFLYENEGGVSEIVRNPLTAATENIICEKCGAALEGQRRAIEEAKEKEAAEQAKVRQAEDMKRRMAILEKSIPPRYAAGIGSPSYPGLYESDCSILAGPYGVGKTWEAYALCKDLLLKKKIHNFRLVTEIGLMIELKSDNFSRLDEKVRYYSHDVDFLVVDEFGKINDSDFNLAHIFEILNRRYDNLKKTLLICNATDQKSLEALIQSAVLDRFRQKIIMMKGESKRYREE